MSRACAERSPGISVDEYRTALARQGLDDRDALVLQFGTQRAVVYFFPAAASAALSQAELRNYLRPRAAASGVDLTQTIFHRGALLFVYQGPQQLLLPSVLARLSHCAVEIAEPLYSTQRLVQAARVSHPFLPAPG